MDVISFIEESLRDFTFKTNNILKYKEKPEVSKGKDYLIFTSYGSKRYSVSFKTQSLSFELFAVNVRTAKGVPLSYTLNSTPLIKKHFPLLSTSDFAYFSGQVDSLIAKTKAYIKKGYIDYDGILYKLSINDEYIRGFGGGMEVL